MVAANDREVITRVLQRLVEDLAGPGRLRRAVTVSQRQLARWRRGDVSPAPEVAQRLRDLDRIISGAKRLWGDRDVVLDWLEGPNAYLGWASPIDVVRLRGPSEVLDAIEEESSGGYA